MSIENIGTSPAVSNVDTEAAPGLPGTAGPGTAWEGAGTDTTGTSVAGIGTALPGGSLTDLPPPGSSPSIGNETGTIDSAYGYGGSGLAVPADTEAVYGGGLPSAYAPLLGAGGGQGLVGSAADPGSLDTTIGGGAVFVNGTPPAYRPPAAYVAATAKDTSLTDILGNQINAPLPYNQLAYAGQNLDTSYFGAPAQPSPLLSQADTIPSVQSATPYYASQLGIMPATLVVKSLGQVIGQTDTVTLNHLTPAALSKSGITSAPGTIVVTDTTSGHILAQNVDYTLAASGSGATLTYSVTRISASAVSSDGDSANVSYFYGSASFFAPATAVLTTDYTVTTAGNGATTALYLTRAGGSTVLLVGDMVTMSYSYGDAQYYDSNLPAPYALSFSDMMTLSNSPQPLAQYGITTAPGSIAVQDVTSGNALAYNTDYSLAPVYLPSTAGSQASSLLGYAITRLLGSPNSQPGDIILVTFAYLTSVPGAPGMGAQVTQADTVTLSHTVPAALSKTGIVTTPAGLVVFDTTSGKLLALGTDYTVTASGSGATLTYSITRVNTSTLSSDSDSATVAYAYGNAYYFSSGPAVPGNRGVTASWTPPAGTVAVDYYLVECSTRGTQYVPATGEPMFYGQPSPQGGGNPGEPTFQSDVLTGFSKSAPVTLTLQGILTPPQQLVVRDVTDTAPGDPMQATGQVLEYGYDYTVTAVGVGPWLTYQIQRVGTSQNSSDGDTITVDYFWTNPASVSTFFTQGLIVSSPVIYNPNGTVRSFQGYRFRVAAGNRAGLGPFSGWSDYVIPLNPNVVKGLIPGVPGGPPLISNSLDPANTVNPVYRPDGTVRAGTGLGG
jgi:hypothetical protein